MPGPTRSSRLALTAPLIIAIALFTACHSQPRNFLNENDELRAKNLELGQHVQQLEQRIDQQLAQIDALQQRVGGAAALEGVDPADLPTLTAIRFGRYSGALDTDGDGADDTLRLYLKTVDQRGRFMTAAGRALVQVAIIEPDQPPKLLGEATFPPDQFDAAYRSNFTGTHYTLEMPLPTPLPEKLGDVTVKVHFTDAATGVTVTAQLPVPLRH